MSLKEHFNSSKTAQSASLSDLAQEVESDRYVEAYRKLRAEYVPNVDFATASNFSHYGSAEKYYEDSVKRIYQNYPYDGSKYEMLCWEISGSHLDKWIYDNRYPKTTGHITMGITGKATGTQENGYGVPAKKEYLYLMGGPHAPESGEDTSTLKKVFDLGNVYDVDTVRENNLEFKLSRGITTEFWLNKEAFDSTSTEHEVIFDLWNQRTSGSLDYGRLRIELAATGSESFRITARSGSSGFTDVSFGSDAPSPATVASSTWKHYAISLINSKADVAAKLYVNGALTATKTITGAFLGPVTGALDATIGSLRTTPSGDLYHSDIGLGSGKLSASLDDFRYWKTERSPKQIGRNWFTNVYGGTNSDDANTMLGVYYKFNEGIYGSASHDATILDYSGRLSNASWINYTSSLGMRSTTSAMVLSNAAERERKDPIIYRTHPEVADLYSGLKVSGSHWDMQNNSSIMNSLPAWTTEYNNQPNKTLQEMTQIVGSYLDKLHQQISSLGSIKEPYGQAYTHNIHSASTVPVPFSDRLVSGLGFAAPELFSEAKMVQALASRDEGYEYEEDIYKIKNQIYQNIYSSIFNIYKSKGTEKAFRNLIRCFGVDDELIKINLYANNSTYTIRDNYRYSSVKQKFISFNHPDRFASTLYQYADPETPNSRSFISGSGEIEEHIPFTLEAEVIFPSKPDKSEEGWYDTYFVTSSVFGMHEADSTTPSDNTIPSTDYCGMVVTAVRPDKDSNDATFVLSSSVLSAPISSSALPIEDVYENTKWNFAVRMRPAKWPFPDYISGSVLKDTHPIGTPPHTPNEDYILDFYGVQMVQDFKQDSFHVSASVSHEDGKNFMVSSKRVFAGAQRADISSAALTHNCDAKISNVAAWYNYIGNKEIDAHARDISNMGVKNPLEPIYIFDKDLGTVAIPQAETLLLHWDFSQVTSSGLESSPGSVDAKYTVADISSGSVANVNRYNSTFGAITEVHHTARGDYNLPSSTKVVSVEYIPTAVQELPEVQNSSDMIKLLSRDDEIFTSDTRPTDYFFAFEKSMYATISEEMVKMFATITDFNNLWGQPVNRYRLEYKDLSKLRQMFFERVSNTPDIDKYIEYYKWFDQAIGKMLLEMIPASVQSTESLVNTVESHVLERNKYWTKYPSMEMKGTDPESGLEGIHRLTENWRDTHHPVTNSEQDNCGYWNKLALRDEIGGVLSSSVESVNTSRAAILEARTSALNRSYTTPVRLNVASRGVIGGGVNFDQNKKTDYVFAATAPFSPKPIDFGLPGAMPLRYLVAHSSSFASASYGWGTTACDDEAHPLKKTKISHEIIDGMRAFGLRETNDESEFYADLLTPFNLIEDSVTTGYSAQINSSIKVADNSNIVNVHHDMYGSDGDTPMQSPFTERHVGGRKFRHNKLSVFGISEREEGWLLLIGSPTGAYALVGPDYPHPYGPAPYRDRPIGGAKFRDETAKRPLNIRNIKTTTAAAGNYINDYEVVQMAGRSVNNLYMRAVVGDLNISKTGSLPQSTHANALFNTRDPEDNFTLPTRESNKVIIASKFSSPGGAEQSSRGFLDIHAEEFSVHNAHTYRNLGVLGSGSTSVRLGSGSTADHAGAVTRIHADAPEGLRTLRQRHSARFGMDSQYSAHGAWHKVYRNTRTQPVTDAPVVEKHDNDYVIQHIPQNDNQYKWIGQALTASSVSSTPTSDELGAAGFGHYVSWLTRPSGSGHSLGSQEPLSFRLDGITSGSLPHATRILRPGNILGEERTDNSGSVDAFNAIMHDRMGPYGWPSWKQTRGGEHPIIVSHGKKNKMTFLTEIVTITDISASTSANIEEFDEPSVTHASNPTLAVYENAAGVKTYVKYSHKPAGFTSDSLNASTFYVSSKDSIQEVKDIGAYDNKLVGIVHRQAIYPPAINYGRNRNRRRQKFVSSFWAANKDAEHREVTLYNSHPYGRLTGSGLFMGHADDLGYSAFGETAPYGVLPTIDSSSFSKWPMDNRKNFLTSNPYQDAYDLGLAGIVFSGSHVPTIEQTTRTTPSRGSDFGIGRSVGNGAGNLLTNYSLFHRGLPADPGNNDSAGRPADELFAMPVYSRPHTIVGRDSWRSPSAPNAIVARGYIYASFLDHAGDGTTVNYPPNLPAADKMDIPGYGIDSDWLMGLNTNYRATRGSVYALTRSIGHEIEGLYTHASPWDAATQAGRGPFYDDYEEYYENLRNKTHDKTVIPEYRISSRIRHYVLEKGSDFTTKDYEWLSIVGNPTSSGENVFNTNGDFLDSDSVENETFYKDYVLSDPTKKFIDVTDEYEDLNPYNLTLTAEALMKFLPYQGFYPATRCEEMTKQFASSYGKYITLNSEVPNTPEAYKNINRATNIPREGKDDHPENKAQNYYAGFRAFYGPLFAPGILFNTIKSGIAVDYPTLSHGMVPTASIDRDGGINHQIGNEYFDYRVPFEALIEPEAYMMDKPFVDMEPHPDAHINVTASWSGLGDPLYKMMMHNFLAEIPNFFLKDGKMKSIQSDPLKQEITPVRVDDEYASEHGWVGSASDSRPTEFKEYRALLRIYKSQEDYSSLLENQPPSCSNLSRNHEGMPVGLYQSRLQKSYYGPPSSSTETAWRTPAGTLADNRSEPQQLPNKFNADEPNIPLFVPNSDINTYDNPSGHMGSGSLRNPAYLLQYFPSGTVSYTSGTAGDQHGIFLPYGALTFPLCGGYLPVYETDRLRYRSSWRDPDHLRLDGAMSSSLAFYDDTNALTRKLSESTGLLNKPLQIRSGYDYLADSYDYPRPQRIAAVDTIMMYSRPSAFGPPCAGGYAISPETQLVNKSHHGPWRPKQTGFTNNRNGRANPSQDESSPSNRDPAAANNIFKSNFKPHVSGSSDGSKLNGTTYGMHDSTNGFNAPFTPPYYDGQSWAFLTWKPNGPGPYTVSQVAAETTVELLRYEWNFVSGAYGDMGTYGPQGFAMNTNAMHLDASLNLKQIISIPEVTTDADGNMDSTTGGDNPAEVWAIQTKFETPILNFIDAASTSTLSGSSQFLTPYEPPNRVPAYGATLHPDARCSPDDVTNGLLRNKTLDSPIAMYENYEKINTDNPNTEYAEHTGLVYNTASYFDNTAPYDQGFTGLTAPVGMWHQYGKFDDDDSVGIFMKIGDIPESYFENGTELPIANPMFLTVTGSPNPNAGAFDKYWDGAHYLNIGPNDLSHIYDDVDTNFANGIAFANTNSNNHRQPKHTYRCLSKISSTEDAMTFVGTSSIVAMHRFLPGYKKSDNRWLQTWVTGALAGVVPGASETNSAIADHSATLAGAMAAAGEVTVQYTLPDTPNLPGKNLNTADHWPYRPFESGYVEAVSFLSGAMNHLTGYRHSGSLSSSADIRPVGGAQVMKWRLVAGGKNDGLVSDRTHLQIVSADNGQIVDTMFSPYVHYGQKLGPSIHAATNTSTGSFSQVLKVEIDGAVRGYPGRHHGEHMGIGTNYYDQGAMKIDLNQPVSGIYDRFDGTNADGSQLINQPPGQRAAAGGTKYASGRGYRQEIHKNKKGIVPTPPPLSASATENRPDLVPFPDRGGAKLADDASYPLSGGLPPRLPSGELMSEIGGWSRHAQPMAPILPMYSGSTEKNHLLNTNMGVYGDANMWPEEDQDTTLFDVQSGIHSTWPMTSFSTHINASYLTKNSAKADVDFPKPLSMQGPVPDLFGQPGQYTDLDIDPAPNPISRLPNDMYVDRYQYKPINLKGDNNILQRWYSTQSHMRAIREADELLQYELAGNVNNTGKNKSITLWETDDGMSALSSRRTIPWGQFMPKKGDLRATGSLCELLGFSTEAVKLGVPAGERAIKEAIVAIPYVPGDEGVKEFLKLEAPPSTGATNSTMIGDYKTGQMAINVTNGVTDPAILEQFQRMEEFILPPHLDFLKGNATGTDKTPFAMYIFPFEYLLDRKDLTDIWQGVMPESAIKVKEEQSSICHTLVPGNSAPMSYKISQAGSGQNAIPQNLRFMVFKIKQRAEINYFKQTLSSVDDDKFKSNFDINGINPSTGEKTIEYSYNWPYDQCSLIEAGKLTMTVGAWSGEFQESVPPGSPTWSGKTPDGDTS